MNKSMDKRWLIAIVPGILALVVGAFIVALFLVKILWAWTIPDLFPGAVDQSLIAKEMMWNFKGPILSRACISGLKMCSIRTIIFQSPESGRRTGNENPLG